MQISNQSLLPPCGRSWRRRTKSSSKPTRRIGRKGHPKWRQDKESTSCYWILLLKIQTMMTSCIRVRIQTKTFYVRELRIYDGSPSPPPSFHVCEFRIWVGILPSKQAKFIIVPSWPSDEMFYY